MRYHATGKCHHNDQRGQPVHIVPHVIDELIDILPRQIQHKFILFIAFGHRLREQIPNRFIFHVIHNAQSAQCISGAVFTTHVPEKRDTNEQHEKIQFA